MRKQKPKGKKKTKKSKAKHQSELQPTWVEQNLRWTSGLDGGEASASNGNDGDGAMPYAGDHESSSDSASTHDISIVTWNVLAESYCTRRSHSKLPMKSQQVVFDKPKRRDAVRRLFQFMDERLAPDVFALQEVDPPLEIGDRLRSLGYEGIETPTTAAGKDGRVDACCLYYRKDRWSCEEHEIIHLNDIATMNATKEISKHRKARGVGNLQGLQSSFFRRNMGILARLQNVETKQKVAILVMHLYWNPAYEYVKLCQAHYAMMRATDFCFDGSPLIVCGDFNSQPESHVHQYMVGGSANARLTAPWHHILPANDDGKAIPPSSSSSLNGDMADLDISDDNKENGPREVTDAQSTTPAATNRSDDNSDDGIQIRYLLDYTLNRLCRWLRILGIDAALETEEEEKLRTGDGNVKIFRRCAFEKRTLITTSSRLLHRRDCPPGTYLLTTKSLANLEMALPHLLSSHGVTIDPTKFLSRCVVCNGSIDAVTDENVIQDIFSKHNAPLDESNETLDVFQCSGCQQGYWWCDQPTSSASRVKNQATKLLELCIQGGVDVKENFGMFDYVDADAVRKAATEEMKEDSLKANGPELQVVHWMKQSKLQNPIGALHSAYGDPNNRSKELLTFSNVTSDFEGLLDYVFYQPNELTLTGRLYVPTSYDELNCQDMQRGHLLPSAIWPSDHLALGACFSFPSSKTIAEEAAQEEKEDGKLAPSANDVDKMANVFCSPLGSGAPTPAAMMQLLTGQMQTAAPPNAHPNSCGCGCLIDTPSLFEMARRRKEAREKLRQKQQQQQQQQEEEKQSGRK